MNQKQNKFQRIIKQLSDIQHSLQKQVVHPIQQQLAFPAEHQIIQFFQTLGYHLDPGNNQGPDEIGYDQNNEPIGFELIKCDQHQVPRWSLQQAIHESRDQGQIQNSVIITNGFCNVQNRRWLRSKYSYIKVYDRNDLDRMNQRLNERNPRTPSKQIANQQKLLANLKHCLYQKQTRQELIDKENQQLNQAIRQIRIFLPNLNNFKKRFKKTAQQKEDFIQQLNQKLSWQQQHLDKLNARSQTHNLQIRLKNAKQFANEIINLI